MNLGPDLLQILFMLLAITAGVSFFVIMIVLAIRDRLPQKIWAAIKSRFNKN